MNTFRIAVASLLLSACCASTYQLVTIGGQVMDPRGGAVVGAEVRLAGRRITTTGSDGRFVIRTAASSRFAVSVSAPGFMSTTKVLSRATDGNTVIIWPRTATKRLSAAAGGRLEFPGGAITFAPHTLVNARGVAATGDVDVALSTFDIHDSRQLRSVPGDFTARMRDGSIRRLETYGVLEVYVADANRERLNLAPKTTATIELPRLGRNGRDPGSYQFDEVDGRWVEVGTFVAQGPGSIFQIPNLLPAWNADDPMNTACIQVQVLGCRGCEQAPQPVAADITADGIDYNGLSYADPNGCISVKSGARCRILLTDPMTHLPNGNPLEIVTPTVLANTSDCGNSSKCPLVVATHTFGMSFHDPMTAADPGHARWCPSDGWVNGAPADTVWDKNQITFAGAGMQLSLAQCSGGCLGKTYTSGEYRTECFHGYGTYEATIDPAIVPGMVTGFFTYTDSLAATADGTIGENNTDGHDEIDIEILGGHPCPVGQIAVQSNWIGKDIGLLTHGIIHCIPAPTSTTGPYAYGFTWSATQIEWYYRTGSQTTSLRTEQQGAGSFPNDPWPKQPGRVMLNLWGVDKNNSGATQWAGTPPTTITNPVIAIFKDVVVP